MTLTYFTAKSNLVPYAFVWEKGKTMDFSETIVICDIKVVDAELTKWVCEPIWVSKVQGHSLTLVQGHSDATYSDFYFLETAWPIEAKFHVEPLWDERTNVCAMVQVTWSMWPQYPYMVKTLKNLLKSKSRWPWKLACSHMYYMYQFCSNDAPGLTLTYFVAWLNLVPYAVVWEKGKTMDFSKTIVFYDIKIHGCSQLNEYMKLYEY